MRRTPTRTIVSSPADVAASLAALCRCSAGCMVGPDYVRPTAPTPPAFKEAEGWKVAQPRDDAPRGTWWEAFDDPDLDALEAQVEVSNQTVAGRRGAACARRRRRRRRRAPRSFPSSARMRRRAQLARHRRRTSTRAIAVGSVANSYNVALDASWEIDLWGGMRRGIESSDATARRPAPPTSPRRRCRRRRSLAQDYLLLRVQDAQIALLRETVAAYERSLQLTRNQYAAGIVARGDVAQAEAQLKSTQAQVLDARITRAQLEHAIAVLVGKPPSELTIAAKPLAAVLPGDSASACRRRCSSGVPTSPRPSAAYRERQRADRRRRRPRSSRSLSLAADGGLQSSVIGGLLVAAQPLLVARRRARADDLRRRVAQRAEGAGDRDVGRDGRQLSLDGAHRFQEVEDNLAALSVLEQEAAVQDDAVKAARESAAIANNQYKAGTANYLAVVVLQRRRSTASARRSASSPAAWRPASG